MNEVVTAFGVRLAKVKAKAAATSPVMKLLPLGDASCWAMTARLECDLAVGIIRDVALEGADASE